MVEYWKLYSTQSYFTDKKVELQIMTHLVKITELLASQNWYFFFQGFVDKGEFYEVHEYCLLKCHCPWDF